MVTKKEAINLVQKYLDKRNARPNIYVFKVPVYESVFKRIQVFLLQLYFKKVKGHAIDLPEFYVIPDSFTKIKAKEIIVEEWGEEFDLCWSISYCTEEYYKTRASRYGSIGGGPVFVDKENGKMYQTGSAPLNWYESFKKFRDGTKDPDEYPPWVPIQFD